jgi:hypothetical protein
MAIAVAIAMTLLVAEGAPFADYFSMNPDLLCPGATRAVTAALLGRAAIGDRFGRAAAFLVAAAPVTLPTSPVRGDGKQEGRPR